MFNFKKWFKTLFGIGGKKPSTPVSPDWISITVSVVPGASVTVGGAKPPNTGTAGDDGTIVFLVPFNFTYVDTWVVAEGFVPGHIRTDLAGQSVVVKFDLVAVPKHKTLPRLVVDGWVFAQEDGTPITLIQASAFNLLNRWQHGEDITPVLQELKDLGFNTLRVWTLFDIVNIGTFLDIDYARIPEFLQLCADFDLYVEFTAYTSTERKDHWGQLVEAVRGSTNVLLELVNEENIGVNSIDLAAYARPVGVLASHGSNGSECWPVEPYWDYLTFHTNGSSEEQRKVGHNAMEIWSGPVLTNETSRFPEVGMWRGGADLQRCKNLAFDASAGASLLCAGSCFHSISGKVARVFTPEEREVAKAWVDGAKSVPLDAQHGAYYRLDPGKFLRVYERRAPKCVGHVEIRL